MCGDRTKVGRDSFAIRVPSKLKIGGRTGDTVGAVFLRLQGWLPERTDTELGLRFRSRKHEEGSHSQ